jgi:hypothetical protein
LGENLHFAFDTIALPLKTFRTRRNSPNPQDSKAAGTR